MDEDLLITNNLNNRVIEKLLVKKEMAKNIYDEDQPSFLTNKEQRVSHDMDENYLINQQFSELRGARHKKKKLKKTYINIDSRNRQIKYTYGKTKIEINDGSKYTLIFYKDSEYFYVITEDTYIDSYKNKLEVILSNIPSSIFTSLGLESHLFEFDDNTGDPIIYIKSIIYNSITDTSSSEYLNPKSDLVNKRFSFDRNRNKFVFNILELKLPGKINKNEIRDIKFGNSFDLHFISDVKIAFDNPSHYKINFGTTYSNIYAAKVVSTEIPNTAYSFNGTQLTTDIGKNKLSSKINNRLRWINKSDKHNIDNYRLSQLKFYSDLKPIYKSSESRTEFQIQQDNFNKLSLNINIHTMSIYASSLDNINITNLSSVVHLKLKVPTTSAFNSVDIAYSSGSLQNSDYLVSNFTTTENIFFVNYLTSILDSISSIDNIRFGQTNPSTILPKDYYPVYFIDNATSVDGIIFNDIPKDSNILLSNQTVREENNIYKVTSNVLTHIVAVNNGIYYDMVTLSKLKIFKYDSITSKYIDFLKNGETLNKYVDFTINSFGSLDSILIKEVLSEFDIIPNVALNTTPNSLLSAIDSYIIKDKYDKSYLLDLLPQGTYIANIIYDNPDSDIPDKVSITIEDKAVVNIIVLDHVSPNNRYSVGDTIRCEIPYTSLDYTLYIYFKLTVSNLIPMYYLDFEISENEITSGNNAKFYLFISNIMTPIINNANESADIENGSYLYLNKHDDQYNYIYKCLKGSFNKNKFYEISKTTTYTFEPIYYYDRLSKLATYYRSERLTTNPILSKYTRDNYSDFSLLGSPTKYGLSQSENNYLKDTSTILSKSLISQLNNEFNLTNILYGYTKNNHMDSRSKVFFCFENNFKLTLSLLGTDTNNYCDTNVISNIFNDRVLPIKCMFLSLDKITTYIYNITAIKECTLDTVSGTLKKRYSLDLIPIKGDFSEFFEVMPFKESTENGGRCVMVIFNPIKISDLIKLNKYSPETSYFLKNYYSSYDINLSDKKYYDAVDSLAIGQVLTATNTIVDAMGSINYQWTRDLVNISTATGSTYTVVSDDVSTDIRVIAEYTDNAGNPISIPSSVANVKDPAISLVIINVGSTSNVISYSNHFNNDISQTSITNQMSYMNGMLDMSKKSFLITYKPMYSIQTTGNNITIGGNIIKIKKSLSVSNDFITKIKIYNHISIEVLNSTGQHILLVYKIDKNKLYSRTTTEYYLYVEPTDDSNTSVIYQSTDIVNLNFSIEQHKLIEKIYFILDPMRPGALSTVSYDTFVVNVKESFYNSIHRFSKFNAVDDVDGSGKKYINYSKNYFELFVGNLISSNKLYNSLPTIFCFEAKFKYLNGDYLDTSEYIHNLFDENHRIHLRPNLNLLINLSIDNQTVDDNNNKFYNILNTIKYDDNLLDYYPNELNNFMQYYEDNLHKDMSYKNDFIDISEYNQFGITNNNLLEGLIDGGLYRSYNFVDAKNNISKYSRHLLNSSNISGKINLGNKYTSTNYNMKLSATYPVYELRIDSGKYTELTFKKFINKKMDKLFDKLYDFQKGIFAEDYNKNVFSELLNINNYNNESKFVIEFNKSIGSVSLKQFTKVFESSKNNLLENNRLVYYNQGFPYVYMKVPELNLPNNSVIYVQDISSLDNIHSSVVVGVKKIIIPNNYNIVVRQMLPLPKSDFMDSNKYLFRNEGYVKETTTQVNNQYVEFINTAVNVDRVKNIGKNYILDKIKSIRESSFNSDYFGLSRLIDIQAEFDLDKISAKMSNQIKYGLKKSYVNNYGENKFYDKVANFDKSTDTHASTSTNHNLEYIGQAMVNNSENKNIFRESGYFDNTEIKGGLETAFLNNELFMKISDVNKPFNSTIIGRITYLSQYGDTNGNHEINYDLFAENSNNFNIGDIIIGLDSGAVGFILPTDYRFNSLPNQDLITLGMGHYMVNINQYTNNSFMDFFSSVDNSKKLTRDLALIFVSNFNKWYIKKNSTSKGFYIRISTTPNVSRLKGNLSSNLAVYIPKMFRLLTGVDTPLDALGFKEDHYNNKFEYYKNNFTNKYELNIKFSYILNNNLDSKQYLILETKNTDNFGLEDEIYIEGHQITLRDVDYRNNIKFKTLSIENFGSFLEKFSTIYNNILQNRTGKKGINDMYQENKYVSLDGNSLNTKTGEPYTTPYFRDDKSFLDWNMAVIKFETGDTGSPGTEANILYYTNDSGKITNIYLLSTGSGYNPTLTEREIDNATGCNFKFTVQITDGSIVPFSNYDTKISDNFGYDLYSIPFTNNYLCCDFSQTLEDYIIKYNLKYTSTDLISLDPLVPSYHNGEYFHLKFSTHSTGAININIILSVDLISSTTNLTKNIIENYTNSEGDDILDKYKSQQVVLNIVDQNMIESNYILKTIWEDKNKATKTVCFIKPGSESYSNFKLIHNRSYLFRIIVKRNLVAFNSYATTQTSEYNLSPKIDMLLGSITSNPTDATNNECLLDLTTTTDVDGYGAILSIVIRTNTVVSVKLTNIGSGYSQGDTLIVSQAQIPNASSELIFKLNSDAFDHIVDIVNYITFDNSEPLSITNRLLENYVNSTQGHNLIKELEIFNKYSQINYSNRIIKIKVCSIDNKGFSYEPVDYINTGTENEQNYGDRNGIANRHVYGYNKKLFPYHENQVVNDYLYNKDGVAYENKGVRIKTYGRVKQSLDNNLNTSKQFLPGMGVYIIKDEIIESAVEELPNTYNDTSDSKILYTYSSYKYDTEFIGYVVNTSIETSYELNQNYRINSNNFSSKESSESVFSEYYIYVLIDPFLTTAVEIDNLFDSLNKDNIHLVYDGSADKTYTKETPLVSPGYTINSTRFNFQYNEDSVDDDCLNTYSLNSNQKGLSNDSVLYTPMNIYNTMAVLNKNDKITMYDNNLYNSFRSKKTNYDSNDFDHISSGVYSNIDALQNSVHSCIIIQKDILNKTLPNYSYKLRIACATVTERPVFYHSSSKNSTSTHSDIKTESKKLFSFGNLDLYYLEQLKNKSVINYEPIIDTQSYRYLNSKNYIVNNTVNLNNRVNNDKECNVHSRYLNNMYAEDGTDKNIHVKGIKNNINTLGSENIDGVKAIVTMDDNSDLVLINSKNRYYSYRDGINYRDINNTTKTDPKYEDIGADSDPIRIISGKILPEFQFNSEMLYFNKLNKLTENTALLDMEFTEKVAKFYTQSSYGKYKISTKDIVGNNSDLYNKSNLLDDNNTLKGNIYNEIFDVIEVGNLIENVIKKGYLISSYNINLLTKNESDQFTLNGLDFGSESITDNRTNNDSLEYENGDKITIPYFKNLLLIINSLLRDKYGSEPFNEPKNTEFGIIERVEVNNPGVEFDIMDGETRQYGFKTLLFVFKNDLLHDHYNSNSGEKYYLTYPHLNLNNKIKIDETSNKYLLKLNKDDSNYLHFSKILKGDLIAIDYGNMRSVENTATNKPPYIINNNFPKIPSTYFTKITDAYFTSDGNFEILIDFCPIIYPRDTKIVLLKNILLDKTLQTGEFIDPLPFNNLSTQPFTNNGKWYTKVFYRGPDVKKGQHTSVVGKNKFIFNKITESNTVTSYTNKIKQEEIFIHSMKGLNIPFINLSPNSSNKLEFTDDASYMGPCDNDYHNYYEILEEDFSDNKFLNNNIGINGTFVPDNNRTNFKTQYKWEFDISPNDILDQKHINLYDNNFNYIIIEGIHFGFGGILEERFNKDIINTTLNNEQTNTVARIKELNNKFFLFVDLDTIESPLIFDRLNTYNKTLVNQSGRSDTLEYSTLFKILEENLADEDTDYQNRLIKFGHSGKISKKIIKHPYKLNPNNYVYLVIPPFNHIKVAQNNKIPSAFAKILLPGDSNNTLYNTFVAGTKIFDDSLYNNLSELEIAFVTNEGTLFDFNGSEHSFTIEITEIIDKFEYINPRFGNIES